MEKVEIIHCPSSVTYGTDASSAVVNIVNTEPEAGESFQLGIASGSNSTIDHWINWRHSLND